MSFSDDPRFRVNAKQTAKNLWQLDCTLEYKSDNIQVKPEIGQDPKSETLGIRLLSAIKETEKAFRDDGRKFVGDKEE